MSLATAVVDTVAIAAVRWMEVQRFEVIASLTLP